MFHLKELYYIVFNKQNCLTKKEHKQRMLTIFNGKEKITEIYNNEIIVNKPY